MTNAVTPPPSLIQGGMGVGISGWRLARAVSRLGPLGVVSGTALEHLLARRLQDGDRGGHIARGLRQFPNPAMVRRVWDAYFLPGGREPRQPYRPVPVQSIDNPSELVELCLVANFLEVYLARQGHANAVGINYLERIQFPHLASIYGAMLAGVDYVLMGAGIPMKVPDVLDRLAAHEPVTYSLTVTGALPGEDFTVRFDPGEWGLGGATLKRPLLLAIVSSHDQAQTLLRRTDGRVDGFVVERPAVGSHGAPSRGAGELNGRERPVHIARKDVDLAMLRAFGRPFWLAGGYGSPGRLREAQDAGAAGVQVGTAFALCAESGLRRDYRRALLRQAISGTADVTTDPLASPMGFPFKVARVDRTLSSPKSYRRRQRICDMGFLREAYRRTDGTVGYRCAAEPVSHYISKGGDPARTDGRKCLCNALVASAGFPQIRANRYLEKGLVTTGDSLWEVTCFLSPGATDYTAADVVATLLPPSITPPARA